MSCLRNSITIILLMVLFILTSCSKEDEVKLKSYDTLTSEEFESSIVPFFYVEKGDSISKDVCREKPEYTEAEEGVVLFSTENKLKSTEVSSGYGFISELFVTDSKSRTPPAGIDPIFSKIPVDLNQGAGGRWLFLYFKRGGNPITNIKFVNGNSKTLTKNKLLDSPNYTALLDHNGILCDLNHGAGGDYIYGQYTRRNELGYAIKDIAIVSGSSSNIVYGSWTKINLDLNRRAGGKHIYLFLRQG
ncbi:hypothetical protein [Ancylomarina sp. 16SWW S1-10-2]|uniref:hypothetical protein n=1 Tax=Ancylomarina sp. 16SWW S1-10-2 TaxID=2499681 RepID=UPI0012AD8B39|nr:hypothetical protein [Ancylomarina sp. 16SWW S1-10-2]MRT94460.1 hypothetical protein [Ancylomarina sp. 16SWW S1-10-2]